MTDKLVSRLDSLQRALGDISTFLKAKSGLSDDEHFEAERCLDQISRSIRALKSISKSSEHESASPEKPVDPKEVALQNSLYKHLMSVRNEIANRFGANPSTIFSNKSLVDMAKFRPSTVENLRKVEDVADEKVKRYGVEVVTAIEQFCKQNSTSMDLMPSQDFDLPKGNAHVEAILNALADSKRISYQLFQLSKKEVGEVASMRGFRMSTICGHLADCIEAGLPVDTGRLGVTDKIVTLVTDVERKPPINGDISRLTPIKDQLPPHVDFNHIKIVLAMLKFKYGVAGDGVLESSQSESDASASLTVSPSPFQENKPSSVAESQDSGSAEQCGVTRVG